MGIPHEHIFRSRDASFLPGIMEATNSRGVDVVLNSLSGELLHASWKCVAEFGIFVEIGRRDFIGQGRLALEQFESNRSFVGFDMAHLGSRRPEILGDLMLQILKYYRRGFVKPSIANRFPAVHVSEAFRHMQKAQHIGKMVVSMPDQADELSSFASYEELRLRSDRAYLFVGGLGGLGRSVAVWLISKGVRHLIFFSRSADTISFDDPLIQELNALSCQVTLVSGDVTKYSDVASAIKGSERPIAGVLQASMVLRVRKFTTSPASARNDLCSYLMVLQLAE